MNALAQKIDQRLKQNNWQQKQLALEWREHVGSGSVSTYVTKLSKLLKGDKEGIDFLLGDAKRVAGLADVLEIAETELRGLAETTLNRLTLILDPRLPEVQRTFLLKRQALAPDTFYCVQVDDPGDGTLREVLRDAARKALNALVVVPDQDEDLDFFAGAGVRTTRVERDGYGYRVVALPELLPPLPPKLHDDDGMPMLPAAQHGDGEGRPLGLRLDKLVAQWGCAPRPGELRDIALKRALARCRSDEETDAQREFIWLKGNEVIVLGTTDGEHVRTITAYHPIHAVKTFDPVVDALAKVMSSLNPHGEGGHLDISSELTAFEKETGVALTFDITDVRKMIAPYGRDEFARGVPVQLHTERDAEVYALLDDLLSREFVLPEEKASILLVMRAMRSAPLAHISQEGRTHSALADIGAGCLVRFNATVYSGEEPTAERQLHLPADDD